MKFNITNNKSDEALVIKLNIGETATIERGSMVAHTSGVKIQGGLNGNGAGVKKMISAAIRSAVSKESIFSTTVESDSDEQQIMVAPALPGAIHHLKVGDEQWRLNDGAFLAKDESVSFKTEMQNLGKAFFGGTGGLMILSTNGTGDLFVNAFGGMVEIEVQPGSPLVVDNQHVVAWSSGLDYQLKFASGAIGFTTGEGLVNEFHGSGKVIIQTRNYAQFKKMIAPDTKK